MLKRVVEIGEGEKLVAVVLEVKGLSDRVMRLVED
jgi:hypothetical protein